MEYSIVLFDGVCNMCNSSINFIIDHDPKKKFRFAALQSEIGVEIMQKHGIDPSKFDSVILIENNNYFTKSTAALRIARQISGIWPIVYYCFIWLPPFLRNVFYDLIAKNRYQFFGKMDACRMPTPELKSRFL